MSLRSLIALSLSAAALGLSACAASPATSAPPSPTAAPADAQAFERDRQAILAMAGEFDVTFDFEETVEIQPGYELAEDKTTPATEVVRVIEDRGDFISLQHLLLVGDPDTPIVIKHWRQDWAYEPDRLLAYQGFNTWEMIDLNPAEVAGAWSQTVYQVDDSPRYAALAAWEHGANAATWEPPARYRPLPRRDATIRDDYDAIEAVNRHTITPWGWTHEQDNSKVILRGQAPVELVREHGLNSYVRTDLPGDHAADAYWAATADYWARVRAAWTGIEMTAETIVVDDDVDGTRLYMPLLNEAQAIADGEKTTEQAWAAAQAVLRAQVSVDQGGRQPLAAAP